MRTSWSRRWFCCYVGHYSEPIIEIQHVNQVQPMEDVDESYESDGARHEQGSGEVSLWQRNILMGGKCRLPAFSGVIVYDSEGNLVAPKRDSRVGFRYFN
ncbi:hypothetical protein MKW92_013584 [Papaver armeniacum]|nr:hypothetical protein MKW92_013584 [Papaver armeniacum]